ncbi:hypothetical protein [Halobellus rufus]|uniref:hypothetical protein n=1 Tax=Halobellus rufus TaxID=1448860 RepID=UPI000678DFD4|nr:hypothetical protein [Halobellus rufus]
MSSNRLLIALCALLLTAGCLGGVPADGTGSDTATQTQTPTAEPRSPITDTSSPTDGSPPGPTPGEQTRPESTFEGTAGWSEQPDPDKAVHVENRWNQSVEIRVQVVREATNETVYDETETFVPGADREVYNLSAANPDGIESFRVTATARNTTESVTIETHECYGDAYVEITESGELFPYYAIC